MNRSSGDRVPYLSIFMTNQISFSSQSAYSEDSSVSCSPRSFEEDPLNSSLHPPRRLD